jgi:hypothetical protein
VLLTIVGGVRDAWSSWRRGRGKTVCARVACRAWSSGPSTSPLAVMDNHSHHIDPAKWPFQDNVETGVVTCSHVLEGREAPLLVIHDAEEPYWSFLCARDHEDSEGRVASLGCIFELDESLGRLADLPVGWWALRNDAKDSWEYLDRPLDDDAEDDHAG